MSGPIPRPYVGPEEQRVDAELLRRERHQVGPTLFFQTAPVGPGGTFRHLGVRQEIVDVIPDPEDGGFLLLVKPGTP